MNYYISTDDVTNYKVRTIEDVPHEKENWVSPTMNKFNNAVEYLNSVIMEGKLECHSNSSLQTFTPKYELCVGLSKTQVDNIIRTINNL